MVRNFKNIAGSKVPAGHMDATPLRFGKRFTETNKF